MWDGFLHQLHLGAQPRLYPDGTLQPPERGLYVGGFAGHVVAHHCPDNPEGSQGRSFRKNLLGQTPKDWRKSIYYRYWTQHEIRPAHIGVRTDRYKLMFIYGQKLHTKGSSDVVSAPAWEFYDLQKDPHEDHNAYQDPAYAPIIRQMKQELLRLREQTGDTDATEPVMQELLKREVGTLHR